ncbi:MAG: SCO family protein [Acidobacteria bacterium]|nr:SCO family protein [Acidobacteriota bacterium]MCL5289343.1 SCO family protein [Acidobacteriota bacterium]
MLTNNPGSRNGRIVFLLTLVAACWFASACQTEKPVESRQFPFRGIVVNVNPTAKTVMIHHDEIPGYMMSMTMEFKLKDSGDYARLTSGDTIDATLVVSGTSSYLQDLKITKGDPNFSAPPGAASVREPKPGDAVPDVQLIDDNGKLFRLRELRGRRLVITFIYTRCPLPDFCPLMNRNFAKIAAELDKDSALARRTVLLSISFDPKYDTPEVLKQNLAMYRDATRPGLAQWLFATGKPDQITSIAEFSGVWYKEQPDQVLHNLRTIVLSPDGKVEVVFRGNEWKPEEVLRVLRQP